MFKIKLLLSVLLLLVSASVGQSGQLNSADILDMYQEAMEKSLLLRKKCAHKEEIKQKDIEKYEASEGYKTEMYTSTSERTYLRDSNRIDCRNEFEVIELNTKNKYQHLRNEECGFTAYNLLGESSPFITAYKKNPRGFELRSLDTAGAAFEGYITGDSYKFLWEVLKGEKDLRLRDEIEEIDGHKTYVLEAKTNHGHYTLWIDPNCGFNLRRCIVHRKDNDLIDGEPLNKPPKQPSSPLYGRKRFPVIEHIFKLDSVKIKNFDGLFLPVEGIVTLNQKFSNGGEYNRQHSYKRFDIDLDPDFSKFEKAFVLDVPDGTRVYYRDMPDTGVLYTWQDGEVVPDTDDIVIEEIDKTTKQIMENGDVPLKLGSVKETENTDDEPNVVGNTQADVADSQPEILSETNIPSFYILIPIGLLIVAVIGWKVFGRLKT